MKKILFYTYNLDNVRDNTGLPTYCKYFLQYMNEIDIYIVNINMPVEDEEKFIVNNKRVDIYIYDLKSNFLNGMKNIIYDFIDENNIDIIFLNDYLCYDLFPEKILGKKKIILMIHLLQLGYVNMLLKQYNLYEEVKFVIDSLQEAILKENILMNYADVVIANSKFTENEIHRLYPEFSKKTISIPLGVDKENIPFYPTNNKKIAYFGRITLQKGMPLLAEQIVNNIDFFKKYKIYMYGDGEFSSIFMKLHIFDNAVFYKGVLTKEKLYEELKDVSVCLFPSIYEPYGFVLSEALSLGKICIVNNFYSGFYEQVNYRNDIVYFINYYYDNLKDVIETIFNLDKKEFEYRVQEGRNVVRDIRSHFDELEKVICSIT